MFTEVLFTIAEIGTSCSGWINNKEDASDGILFNQLKGHSVICDNMDGSWRTLCQVNNSEKDKYCMIALISWESKKAKSPETEIRMVATEAWGGRKGVMLVRESKFQL